MSQRNAARRRRRANLSACLKHVESRRLLAAELTVLVSDGNTFNASQASAPSGNPLRIDFSTMTRGGAGSSKVKTLCVRNDGDAPHTVTDLFAGTNDTPWFRLEAVPGHQFPPPNSVTPDVTLDPGEQYHVRIVFPTHQPVGFLSSRNNGIVIRNNDANEANYKFFVFGQVVLPSVAQVFPAGAAVAHGPHPARVRIPLQPVIRGESFFAAFLYQGGERVSLARLISNT